MFDKAPLRSEPTPIVERRSPNVILYREVPETTSEGIRDGFARACELAGGRRVYLLVDLTTTGKPDDVGMAAIKQGIVALKPLFISVFTGQGMLANLIAGYVMASTLGRGAYGIFKTEQDALDELRRRGASL
jgi:hypothetical protein